MYVIQLYYSGTNPPGDPYETILETGDFDEFADALKNLLDTEVGHVDTAEVIVSRR